MNELTNIEQIAKRRYLSLAKRCQDLKMPYPTYEEILLIFQENYNSGGLCEYCGDKLEYGFARFPYKKTPSLEHKKPLSAEGTNKRENLAVVCVECNLVKGTMSAELFCKLIPIFKEAKLWDQYREEAFMGALGNKIARVQKEDQANFTEDDKKWMQENIKEDNHGL